MVMLDSIEFVAAFLGALRIGAVPGADESAVARTRSRRHRRRCPGTCRGRSRPRGATALDELRPGRPRSTPVITTVDRAGRCSGPLHRLGRVPAGGDGQRATRRTRRGPSRRASGCAPPDRPATEAGHAPPRRHPGDLRDLRRPGARASTADDVCFSVGPMFHAYGLGNSLTFPFSVGATAVLEPTRPPTPDSGGRHRASHTSATLFFCIPTFYAALIASDLADDTFASVRFGVSAAEALPGRDVRAVQANGSASRSSTASARPSCCTSTCPTLPGTTRPGTSGVAGPRLRGEGRRRQTARTAAGEPGQLLVRGDSMTTGYWCRTETIRSTFDGPWMRTGDLYSVDADGFHTYLGRVDDMLRVGGEWVSPAEVEGVLIEHDSVLEAAMVGQSDDQRCAATDRLRDQRRPVSTRRPTTRRGADRPLPRAPRRLQAAKALRDRRRRCPKTATGKIQRFKLR